MKGLILVLLLGLTAVGLGLGLRSTDGDAVLLDTSPGPSVASYLYTQSATEGSFEQDAAGATTLVLEGVSPLTIAFTDRPIRDAHDMRTVSFVNDFALLFAGDPPNAELSFESEDGSHGSAILILSDPAYDESAGTLSYGAVPIPLDGSDGVSLPQTFGRANLFIDDGSTTWKISGTVANPDGKPLTLVTITAITASDMSGDGDPSGTTTTTDGNGAFSLSVPMAAGSSTTITIQGKKVSVPVPGDTSVALAFTKKGYNTVKKTVSSATSDLTITLSPTGG